MRRVAVLGSGGAGKTTFATALAERTGLPVLHLDPLFWQPGWTRPAMDAWRAELDAVVARDAWIVDGNFLGPAGAEDADARWARADTVLFLDLPRTTCLWRALRRRVVQRGTPRPDLPDGCRETVDLAFLRWIWDYPRDDRPQVLTLLARIEGRAATRRLRTRGEVRRFLDAV